MLRSLTTDEPARRSGRPAPTQSLTLFLMLALTLAGAAGAQGDAPAAAADDPVLVQLGATRERASFVMERFEIAVRGVASSQGTPYDRGLFTQLYGFLPTFLEQRATELVLLAQARLRGIEVAEEEIDEVVAGIRANLGDEEAFARVLADAGFRDEAQLRDLVREAELVGRVLTAIREAVVVSDDEITIAYHAQRLRFSTPTEACVRHILVEDAAHAAELHTALEAGAEFAEIARTESIDPGSAARGGELGCLPRGVTVAAFDEAVFSADVGAYVGPVETEFGHHVLQVYDLLPAQVRPLADVRDEIEQELLAERADVTIAAIVASSGVLVFPESIPPLEDEDDEAAGA